MIEDTVTELDVNVTLVVHNNSTQPVCLEEEVLGSLQMATVLSMPEVDGRDSLVMPGGTVKALCPVKPKPDKSVTNHLSEPSP